MSRVIGTVSMGLRAPIIHEGDDLSKKTLLFLNNAPGHSINFEPLAANLKFLFLNIYLCSIQ